MKCTTGLPFVNTTGVQIEKGTWHSVNSRTIRQNSKTTRWSTNAGYTGKFHFKERNDGQKVLVLSLWLMSDNEWAAWVKENGEPSVCLPPATEFPNALLGVKIPKTAPQDAKLFDGYTTAENKYGKHDFRYWREDHAPIDHPLFTHSHNQYSLRTKTTVGLAFSRTYSGVVSEDERKAAEDEVIKLAQADGFDCHDGPGRIHDEKDPNLWGFSLDAERPDGIKLYADVWRFPEDIRKRYDLADETELRVVIDLADEFSPKSLIWQEGLVEEIKEPAE